MCLNTYFITPICQIWPVEVGGDPYHLVYFVFECIVYTHHFWRALAGHSGYPPCHAPLRNASTLGSKGICSPTAFRDSTYCSLYRPLFPSLNNVWKLEKEQQAELWPDASVCTFLPVYKVLQSDTRLAHCGAFFAGYSFNGACFYYCLMHTNEDFS